MCNTFAVYFQIFATFGYKKVKNSDYQISFSDTTTAINCDKFRFRTTDILFKQPAFRISTNQFSHIYILSIGEYTVNTPEKQAITRQN